MIKLKLKILGTEVEYKGNEKFLETKVPKLLEAFKKSYNDEVKRNLLEVHEDLQRNLANMESYSASMSRLSEELDHGIKEIHEKLVNFLESIETLTSSPSVLFSATEGMQEMNRAFSMQYLGIQEKIQQETREFNLMSNIMKTKHEAAKNSINNIR